jgi:predicted Zn-dependent protease
VNAGGGLSVQEQEKLVAQGLKLVAMHEVGHTLGLRHNFKG